MGLSGQTFMDLREEFNKMPDMSGAEYYEDLIRSHYGDELADEYHQLIEKVKAVDLLTNEIPTADDLDNLFNCADDEIREITFNNDESTVIVDGNKYKIDANGESKIVDDESE